MSELWVRNLQRSRPIQVRLLRDIARAILAQRWPAAGYDIGIYVVSARRMARLNEQFLQHSGSTDVITFAYAQSGQETFHEPDSLLPAHEPPLSRPAETLSAPRGEGWGEGFIQRCKGARSDKGSGRERRFPHQVHEPNARAKQKEASHQPLSAEIFISIDDAAKQAREFHSSWQAEVVRYMVHGFLHLEGHDDLASAPRRLMKRAENRLMKELARRFPLSQLSRKPRVR